MDFSTMSDAELAEAIKGFRETLDEIFASENPTREDREKAKETMASLRAAESVESERKAEAEEFASMKEDYSKPAEESEPEPEQPVEASAEEDDKAEDSEQAVPDEEKVEAQAEQPKARTASARERLADRKPEPPANTPTGPRITITAAADTGYAVGTTLPNLNEVAQALTNRAQGFPGPAGEPGGKMHRYSVAFFHREKDEALTASTENESENREVIDFAANETRLPGGSLAQASLTASGWCAPSEDIYGFCPEESTDGMFELPTFQVKRGGVRYSTGVDFSTIYDESGFWYTEAELIAGDYDGDGGGAKPCFEIPCDDWTEYRLEATGLCIKVPLVQNAAYPELTANVISRSLIAHGFRKASTLLQKVITASGAAITATNLGSTTSSTLAVLEVLAEAERENHMLAENATLEVVAPSWLRGAIRSDLAQRNGVELLSVTNQQINAYFASRNLRVQWVRSGWQRLEAGVPTYPATVDVVMYPAGTFTAGEKDVIRLDAVYDAAELSQNRYTGLFLEEGVLLVQRCYDSRLVTIPVCSSGRTGEAGMAECLTTDETATTTTTTPAG